MLVVVDINCNVYYGHKNAIKSSHAQNVDFVTNAQNYTKVINF